MNYVVGIMKTIDRDKDLEVREEHIQYLNALIEQGKIFAKGPFLGGAGGLIIFSVNSLQEAKELADNDPVIKQNSRTMELYEWKSNL